MDALTEELAPLDVDPEMTALTPEDFTGQNLEASDEVENLRNSLREAVSDDNVQPKMQCLMMDPSFSMVTMQGEDSGIAWETTPSRSSTPWTSEAGTVDLSSPVAVRPATPGSVPAGKIIFVMDDELFSRRKRTKGRKRKSERQRVVESSENISGRPELFEVSQPNVKTEEEEVNDPMVDEEQMLFRLVSEGSEILNIVVPPKMATVDEEESEVMVDNLSYLEDSLVPKASEEIRCDDLVFTGMDEASDDQVNPSSSIGPNKMDPPGAPVARPPGRAAAGNADYFEAFTLVEAEAPGGPAVIVQEQQEEEEEEEEEAATEIQDTAETEDHTTTPTTNEENDKSDTISLEEISSELLDEVFYGGTDNYMKPLDKEDERPPSRLPSKPSGSTLFGSQEDILTPIFLPEGPLKIIDQILLEEPKAMAFLYTDLYEEAVGCREKEEDTESMTSEKSFHSRHSDREARGYLEKYVLIDETPALEVEPAEEVISPEEGSRVLAQDLCDFDDLLPEPEQGGVPNSEEEITDFFRASDNSSPCDVDPFPRSPKEDEAQSTTKNKQKTTKKVSIKVKKVPEDPLSVSSFEFVSDDPFWERTEEHPAALDEKDVSTDQEMWKQDLEKQKPVAPPRRKATSSFKACLDLTPLTPVDDIMQEKEEAGGKEQRVEEKETASPAETADEGDGDGEEMMQPISNDALMEDALVAEESPPTASVEDNNEITFRNTTPAAAEEKDTTPVEEEDKTETEAAPKQTEPEEVNITSSELVNPEKLSDRSNEAAKDKGQCVIL
ncbi:calpastatin [Pseudochaenichthys georgianus]|uniref:calpastatin n=1 Tax=Pseudochaenichthys georgianus TaxID=52239 RepID=UPI00146DC5BD|nr:cardiomyopathy-associated protein 5 [Pseudochaenichthys georgianus]